MEIIYQNENSSLKYSSVFEKYIIKINGKSIYIEKKFIEELKKDKGLVEAIKNSLE